MSPSHTGSRDFYENLARTYATESGIDPDIFALQINQESGFRPLAGSEAGAQGIAQIIPQFHPGVDPWDPDASLRYAAQLMAGHLQNYGGDIRKALTAYHAGPGILNRAIELGGLNWEGSITSAANELGFSSDADRIGRDNRTYLAVILGGDRLIGFAGEEGELQLFGPTLRGQLSDPNITGSARERLTRIAALFFGQPSDMTPEDPFPGFLELVSPFEREMESNVNLREVINRQLLLLSENTPTIGGAIAEGLGGPLAGFAERFFNALHPIGAPLGKLPGKGGEIFAKRQEEFDAQVGALVEQRGVLLAKFDDIARLFLSVELQFDILQDPDPEVRTKAQAKLDQLTATSSPTQAQIIEPVLSIIRSELLEPVEQLSVMSPEAIASLSGVDITEKLFEDRRGRPIASYLLTTEQLGLSLVGFRAAGPPELTTGEQIRQILMDQGLDSEEADAYREDTLARVEDRIAEYEKLERDIEGLIIGGADWQLPSPGVSQYLKIAAIQPILLASEALDKYFRAVPQPIAGGALRIAAFIIPGEQAIERDLDTALEDNNLWQAAGEAWRANTWHPVTKFLVETIADPTSYIGWGIAARLVKPLPRIGGPLSRMVAAAEFGYLELTSAPFRAVGSGLRGVIKRPAATLGMLAGESATGDLMKLVTRANPNTRFSRITAEQVTETLTRALERGYQFPDGIGLADLGVSISKILRAQPVPNADTIMGMAKRAGGVLTRESLESSKTVFLDVETRLVAALNDPDKIGIMSQQLMTILGVEDTASGKGFAAVKSLVTKYVEAGETQAQRLIQGETKADIFTQISKFTRELTVRNHESSAAIQAINQGRLSTMLGRTAEGIGAVWSGTVEKWMIRPLARSYLLFGMYHLWNVAETKGKAALAGINPFFRGNRGQMYVNAWADAAGVRTEVLLGGGRGLMWGETVAEVQQVRQGIEKFLAPKAVSRLFREELAIKVQAADQALIHHQLATRELKRLLPKEWEAIDAAKKAAGWDFKFLPRDIRPWAQDAGDAAILRGPDALRDMPGELTAEKLRSFNIERMLGQYEYLDSHMQTWILEQAKSGRLFTNTDDVGREVLDMVWEKHLSSPEFFASNFEEMVEEILTAPINNFDDLSKRLVTLQGMSRSYGAVLEHQHSVAREASGRVIDFAKHDEIFNLWRKGSEEFGTRAGASLDTYIGAIRKNLSLAGDKIPDVELYLTRVQALRELDDATWSQTRLVREQIFGNMTKKERVELTNTRWFEIMDMLGQPFRDNKTARKGLITSLYSLEARIGEQTKFAIPDVSGRTISRIDIAAVYGGQPDDVTSMVQLVDLQAIMGKDEFTQEVLNRVLFNRETGQELAALGWTEEAVGKVWDDIMRQLRLNPDNVSVIAPTLMQVDDMVKGVRLEAMRAELPQGAKDEFVRWTDDLAERLKDIPGYYDRELVITSQVSREVVTPAVPATGGTITPVARPSLSLPKDLKGAKPRYNIGRVSYTPEFSSDIDKALFIVAQTTPSKRNKDYLQFLREAFPDLSDKELKELGKLVREEIKTLAKKQGTGGSLNVPDTGIGPQPTARQGGIPGTPEQVTKVVETVTQKGSVTPNWLGAKGESLDSATTEFFRMFPDYVDLNYLDKFFRSQFPFWIYEWHRLWYLPRQFMRTPGLVTGIGRYNEATGGDNYIQVPFTSLEINPLRGTILMGGLRRLLVRDFPEFYDTFPKAQQALDIMGRWGFYPGAHVTIGNLLLGTAAGPQWDQLGEIVPVWMKAPIQAFQGFAELTGNDTMIQAAKRLADVFIPERFRNYMIGLKVSQIGAINPDTGEFINGADLNSKMLAGTPLSELEQDLWDRATGEMAPWMLLMDQTGLFRFRPEEKQQALKELNIIFSEYSGYTVEQLEEMRKWGINPFDIIPPTPEVRDLLNATEYMQRWAGSTNVLFGASEQQFRSIRSEFYTEVTKGYLDRKVRQEVIDCQWGFAGATSCDHPGSISSRDWGNLRSELGAESRTFWNNLRAQERYRDIAMTIEDELNEDGTVKYEGLVSFYQRTGQPLPIEHPATELLRMYFDIQLVTKFDPETGQLAPDFDTLYLQQEIFLQTLGDYRDEIEPLLRENDTELEKLRRWSYTQYLRPYFNRRELTISRFSPDAQQIINRWLASDSPLERDQLEAIQYKGKSLIGQYQSDIRRAGQRLRFYSPDIDAWVNFWGAGGVSSFQTDEGQRRYEDLIRRYRPGHTVSPSVEATVLTLSEESVDA